MTARGRATVAWVGGGLAGGLLVSGCSTGADPAPVDLPTGTPSSATSGPTAGGPSFEPTVPEGSVPPTLGVPTEARAELRDAERLEPAVLAAWRGYQEARAESLRAHDATDALRASAAPSIVQMVQARGPDDAADGVTVSLRPLGRLESVRADDGSAALRTCLWAPSVGFFVEATGEEAEGGDPGWVEYDTRLTREGSSWIVSRDERTGRTCAGGAP